MKKRVLLILLPISFIVILGLGVFIFITIRQAQQLPDVAIAETDTPAFSTKFLVHRSVADNSSTYVNYMELWDGEMFESINLENNPIPFSSNVLADGTFELFSIERVKTKSLYGLEYPSIRFRTYRYDVENHKLNEITAYNSDKKDTAYGTVGQLLDKNNVIWTDSKDYPDYENLSSREYLIYHRNFETKEDKLLFSEKIDINSKIVYGLNSSTVYSPDKKHIVKYVLSRCTNAESVKNDKCVEDKAYNKLQIYSFDLSTLTLKKDYETTLSIQDLAWRNNSIFVYKDLDNKIYQYKLADNTSEEIKLKDADKDLNVRSIIINRVRDTMIFSDASSAENYLYDFRKNDVAKLSYKYTSTDGEKLSPYFWISKSEVVMKAEKKNAEDKVEIKGLKILNTNSQEMKDLYNKSLSYVSLIN